MSLTHGTCKDIKEVIKEYFGFGISPSKALLLGNNEAICFSAVLLKWAVHSRKMIVGILQRTGEKFQSKST